MCSIVLAANTVINLFILGIFKYYNFFVSTLYALLVRLGFSIHISLLPVILPAGISFYTFQAISYVIDVYRKRVDAVDDAVAFFAFISFFPQLVAGPIERAENLLPQMLKPRVFNYADAVDGMKQMLWGFFKKVVVADNCADVVNKVWEGYASHGTALLLVAAVLFAFQIYGDFSGYSDIAIGTARLFGIRLHRNFAVPYFSRSVIEFWRRWHISLMEWFTDYIYIPLGGSKCSIAKGMRNTFAVFIVSGIWHGANWTFIAWGLYHAVLFIPMRIAGRGRFEDMVAQGRLFPSIQECVQMLLTFICVTIGWILFRSQSINEAAGYFSSILVNSAIQEHIPKRALFFVMIMLLVEWIGRDKEYALQFYIRNTVVRRGVYISLILAILMLGGHQAQFIYSQF